MSRKGITFRFRKILDDDLIRATEELSDGALSDLARNGLRLMLGIRTSKQIEVKERPLTVPIQVAVVNEPVNEKTAAPPGRPAVFTNQNINRR